MQEPGTFATDSLSGVQIDEEYARIMADLSKQPKKPIMDEEDANDAKDYEIIDTLPAQTNSGVVEALTLVEKHFGPIKTVFYPGCGIDVSLIQAFPHARVTFLDPCKHSYASLILTIGTRLHAVINDQLPLLKNKNINNKHDVGLLMNAHGGIENLVPYYIKSGGYIIAEKSWNDCATKLIHLKCVGVIYPDENGNFHLEQNNLQEFLTPKDQLDRLGQTNYQRYAQYYIFQK